LHGYNSTVTNFFYLRAVISLLLANPRDGLVNTVLESLGISFSV